MADISPDKVSPEARMMAERLRIATEAHMTNEQRFERFMGKQPGLVRALGPNTIGEAGYAGGGLAAAALTGLGLAPESAGGSLVLTLPMLAAMAGGAIEDPKHPFSGGLYEGGKAALTEAGGRLATKGVELAGRYASKLPMLEKSAQRMMRAVPGLFYKYPLKNAPGTVQELQDQIGGGKVAEAAGQRLGKFRDALAKEFGEYKPAVAPKLVNASPGVPMHYTAEVPASGQSFLLPDVVDGKIVMRRMGIKDAIDHVRGLQAGSVTVGGAVKRTENAPLTAEIAAKARDALTAQLSALHPEVGQMYQGFSRDYGVARQLEKVFVSPTRETQAAGGLKAVIDQPKVKVAAEKVAAKLERLRPGAGTKLTKAIAPTGTAAKEEIPFGPRIHGGPEGLRAYMHPPIPFNPESREQLPLLGRIFSDPKLARLYGYLGQRGIEEQE